MGISPARWRVVGLLLLGALAWAGAEASAAGFARPMGLARWLAVIAAAGAALAPPIRMRIQRALSHMRYPSRRAAAYTGAVVALVAAIYLFATAKIQDRDLFAKTHDDSSYVIQTHMLARGRLWMPPHPLADFFDSFYLMTRPVYASQYFPGTAMLNAPGIWLGWPTWVIPLLCAAGCVGMSYRVLTDLLDGVSGLLGALLLLSLSWFRMLSVLVYSQTPMLLLGLMMLWAGRRWAVERRWRWIMILGVAAGWGAITRPVDALCYALPIGLYVISVSKGRRLRIVVALVAAAAPFLAVQAIFNVGVTGSIFKTPFQLYQERDYPGTGFGFPRFDASARPASVIAQKQAWYDQWAAQYIQWHQPNQVAKTWLTRWLPMMAAVTLPFNWLLLFAPAGVAALWQNGRWILAAVLPLFVLFYILHTFFLEHYSVVVAPAVGLLVLAGIRCASSRLAERGDGRYEPAVVAAIVMACLSSFYELNPLATSLTRDPPQRERLAVSDETFRSPMLRILREQLPYASDFHSPAVILFRYSPGEPIAQEPVYNIDAAWPDDAPIIRAHDLGPRNREIFAYYAARQPGRMFYRFDRATKELTTLGLARELAATSP